ncbi:hypothetical protein PYW08_011386 [Mythimna loreyi]|uniref:Uncharacterized protein n=1 Tax=Mythimna loreyi TaxID=667449 RepID=A0ACC2Q5Y9_9NEOP|nr:hypothetical protein PYW08_011386 [Mythimna loreyi]
MHWYGGSIEEAVNLSKQKNSIFVVFVEGDNDLSAEMAATIDDAVVLKRLSNQGNFLAVKLKSGSANYLHFAQIYQFVPVPSLFFIGRNGTPLEVVCAGVQPNNLATRIDRILEEHFKDKPSSGSSSLAAQPSTSSTAVDKAAAAPASKTTPPASQATPPASQATPPASQATPPASLATPPASLATAPLASLPTAPPASPATGFQQNIKQTVSFVQTETTALSQQAAKEEVKTEPDTASVSPSPAKIAKTSSEETREPKALTPEDMVCDGDVCVRRPPKPDEPGPSQAPMPSLGPTTSVPEVATENAQESLVKAVESGGSIEEKMERAKELIEARRREKAEKEKELEKEKEIERRQAGKGVAELKRWQAEQELKQIQEERRREKMENNLARQRILEQIAQDRAERRARDQPQSTQPQQPMPATPTSGDGGGRARIQFKLPDGTSHTAHFDANGTLREVQRYVADNLRLSTSNFALWTAFPRQELTDADASLRGLQLAPSAALLVLPRRATATVASPSAVSSLITFFTQLFTTMILEPSQTLVTWLRTRLFPPPATPPSATRSPSPGPMRPASPTGPGAQGPRRRGNIHRLPSDRAPDDDNNTWNGNSTQQM